MPPKPATTKLTPTSKKSTLTSATSLAPSPKNLFIGTSGWAYPTWKPGFYPANLPTRAFLHEYASRLTSVEVNYTFRTLPTTDQLTGWLAATPPRFRFSFKAPQRITHFQRLRDSHDTLAEFLTALAPAAAANKLGPILFQLPPNFRADNSRLADFLKSPALKKRKLQLAFEFRHDSWFTESTYAILRRHNAAISIADTADLTTPEVHTASFHHFRLRHPGGYTPAQIKSFATRFTTLAKSAELFAYFMHEDEPTGPQNAEYLIKLAGKCK